MTGATAAKKRSSFLSRLLSDQSGNVIAITAAATLPMIAVVGGAVDMSRVYMARTSLQAACDAGVLAGRKAMTTLTYTTAAQARADNMFKFNFKENDHGTSGTVFTDTGTSTGIVNGEAETVLPTVLMKIFGKNQTAIKVKCSADIQAPNIDVVMVLDVTGSMNCSAAQGNSCPGGNNNMVEHSDAKIKALRTAVKNFHSTIMASIPSGSLAQVRFGFVPYSQSVNGSDLFKASPDASKGELPLTHLADTVTVQSRVANFNTLVNTGWIPDPNTPAEVFQQRFDRYDAASYLPNVATMPTGTPISTFDCDRYSENKSFNVMGIDLDVFFTPRTSFSNESEGSSEIYSTDNGETWSGTQPTTGSSFIKATFSRESSSWSNSSPSQYQTCIRNVTKQKYIWGSGYKFTNWTYKPITVDASQYKQGNELQYVTSISSNYMVPTQGSYDVVQLRQLPNQSGLSSDSTTWDGCLDERDTVAVSSFTPIPDGAKDLDYKIGGTDLATQWRTQLRDISYLRSGPSEETKTGDNNQPDYRCPSAKMRNLNPMTTAQINTYADSLYAGGYTYLDVGMIWGLRMITSDGVFASRNRIGPNGGQISRFIVFLTDGIPVSAGSTYSSYGMEQVSKKITGSLSDDAATLHARRFQALCDEGARMGSVWTIAFGTSKTGNMEQCASSTSQAIEANDTTTLNAAFTQIANDIKDLRLTR
jgi:Flp pilus assembly protein TadG